MTKRMNAVAAAIGAIGIALSAPLWAQQGGSVGPGESGPATMERPAKADTRQSDQNFGGAKAPGSQGSATAGASGAAGCDKLSGKNREDCLARRDAAPVTDARTDRKMDRKVERKDRPAKGAMRSNTGNPPLAGQTPGVGPGESGPATMERPATANTRDSSASAGGAKAPDGAASNARRGPADKPVR